MRGKQDHSRERNLRKTQTDAERHLWRYLRNRLLNGFKFRRQHSIGKYIADLLCDEKKLVIEIDGSQHFDHEASDNARTQYLEARDYRVIRFWNHDVLTRTEVVLCGILRALETHPSP